MKSLQDWVKLLGTLRIPVLRSTVDELARLQKDQESATGRDLSTWYCAIRS